MVRLVILHLSHPPFPARITVTAFCHPINRLAECQITEAKLCADWWMPALALSAAVTARRSAALWVCRSVSAEAVASPSDWLQRCSLGQWTRVEQSVASHLPSLAAAALSSYFAAMLLPALANMRTASVRCSNTSTAAAAVSACGSPRDVSRHDSQPLQASGVSPLLHLSSNTQPTGLRCRGCCPRRCGRQAGRQAGRLHEGRVRLQLRRVASVVQSQHSADTGAPALHPRSLLLLLLSIVPSLSLSSPSSSPSPSCPRSHSHSLPRVLPSPSARLPRHSHTVWMVAGEAGCGVLSVAAAAAAAAAAV